MAARHALHFDQHDAKLAEEAMKKCDELEAIFGKDCPQARVVINTLEANLQRRMVQRINKPDRGKTERPS